MQIREISLQELESAYEVVKELRQHLSYDAFENLVYDMRHQEYKMFGVYERDELVCYAGASVLVNLYHGRHLYLYDLVTKATHRSQGYGKIMLEYLNDYAKMHQCEHFVLTSGHQRQAAHRFYRREGFEGVSEFFIRPL